ncbi:DUF3306 domain-containing protein [Vibrio penaeicida]|uniref:DUF3306 domain-containing protein n=1 Tax=Vibrio penaeicida TaxID=104609 RepID=UPI000CE9BA47|nr:DUF3306 domain-containing protein [Vibrio penaeicida]
MASDFLKRWSQRKLQDDEEQASVINQEHNTSGSEVLVADVNAVDIADANLIEDTDVDESKTSKESLLEDDDPSGEPSVATLLSKGAETAVKKAALRKLFLSGEFSEVDALNDYDHDYSKVGNLTQEAAEKLRGWVKEKLDETNEEEKNQAIAMQDKVLKENEDANSEELSPQSEEPKTKLSEPKIEQDEPQSEENKPNSGMSETKYTT